MWPSFTGALSNNDWNVSGPALLACTVTLKRNCSASVFGEVALAAPASPIKPGVPNSPDWTTLKGVPNDIPGSGPDACAVGVMEAKAELYDTLSQVEKTPAKICVSAGERISLTNTAKEKSWPTVTLEEESGR